jgi:type VII secretion protein EccE
MAAQQDLAIANASSESDASGHGTPRRAGVLGLAIGQIVAAQLALAAVVAAIAAGLGWLALAIPVALGLLVGAFGRTGNRWLYEWAAQGARYFGRRKTLPAGSDGTALLELLRPASTISTLELDNVSVGIVEDAFGLTAVLEAGDTTGLLAEALSPVPAPEALLPTALADQPNVRLQLLFSGVAAPTPTATSPAAASSYRQLTDGRILAQQRVLLAVHVRRLGGFGDAELRRCLASAIRRVVRRLNRAQLPCRPLASSSVLQVLVDLAHHDPQRPVRETWTGVEVGSLRQVCFQLARWPEQSEGLAQTLIPRLLTLPGGSTTVSLAMGHSPDHPESVKFELLVRLTAPSTASLGASIDALHALLRGAGARVRRLDGNQLAAFGATLPLGGNAHGPTAALAGLVAGHESIGVGGHSQLTKTAAVGTLEVPITGAGLMLGVNRRGDPVTVRLFRPEPTRAALVGGLRCGQTIVLRALALGANVLVQTGRPYEWEPFLRGVSGHGTGAVTMVAPGRLIEPPQASPVNPQLIVVDIGPIGATGIPVVEAPWRATLLVRDELNRSDVDVLARADLALLQPLSQQEAYFAAAALGLGDSASWLTRIRADMVGVVVGRRTLRWALLSGTPIEQQLIGPPTR